MTSPAPPPPPPPPPPASNQPPTATPVSAQMIPVAHTAGLDLTTYFSDPDGDALTFQAESSDASVVTATLADAALTLEAVREGTVDVTLRATDPSGQSAQTAFQVVADYGDSVSVAGAVSPGDTAIASLAAGDRDVFAIAIPTDGFRLAAYTQGATDTGALLYDDDDNLLTSNDDSGEGTNLRIVRQLYARTYYLHVVGVGGATGDYSLILEEATESDDDHGDLPLTSTSVSIGDTVEAVLAPSDVDVFEFSVQPEDFFRLSAFAESSLDTYGLLWDADGSRVLINDDGGAGLNFWLNSDLAAGTYYLGVRAFRGDTQGPYSLILEEREADDHGNSFLTATSVSVGDTVQANLATGDVDFFTISIPTDDFRLRAFTEGTSDTFGALYDADGSVIATSDDDGARFNFDIVEDLAAGTYYLRVTGFQGRPGDYTLIIADDDADADRFDAPFEDDIRKEIPDVVEKNTSDFPSGFLRLGGGRARR